MPGIAMDGLSKLEAESERLAATIKSYVKYRREVESSDQLRASPDANMEASRTKSAILASVANIKTLLGGPVELLQDLARQVCGSSLTSHRLHFV